MKLSWFIDKQNWQTFSEKNEKRLKTVDGIRHSTKDTTEIQSTVKRRLKRIICEQIGKHRRDEME